MKFFSCKKKSSFLILLLPLGILLTQISRMFPTLIEKYYSSFFYKIIANILSAITHFLPFSLAELTIIFFVTFALLYILKTTFDLYKYENKRLGILKHFVLNILAASGLIYFSFQFLWGFNYQRLTLNKIFQLNVRSSSSNELASLCMHLINSSSSLRKKTNENQYGVMELSYNKKYILKTAQLGYDKVSLKYAALKGNYGIPKGILLSSPMCYTGITGFYFPFTNEANINMAEPDSFLPFTTVHEMAHQRGFAKEDEANYIAYIACINHPYIDFQYSGTLAALSYSLNALQKSDSQKYKELILTCSTGVINDLKYNQSFWEMYSGPIEKIGDKINDTYLKSQNQQSGTKSYGAMVDLLLADYREK
ncbi:DUF3810 domain-containing protein [Clostridium sp. CF011]|uniref:DUF3810 domain-containing protein n=1 Tax=unclassified Clostridium TaxID=2614128 RepID=UPI001C0B5DB1|nr:MULTISPECIES: DUF3810 domain-containing protein [unclassified Clostridium]MBU3091789.1 DUF3810 domain-containing protein [Clostridium sp. CF011]MBW9145425.1 DUF3810 domain-containing protein [Clostridium sp. CM027]UVE39405.1 DUF3810 domain-containing protein [Clostridium sp. CM027]WAG68310.1 DUF3810 domain-containing protein [Clostridium sp. CF011]